MTDENKVTVTGIPVWYRYVLSLEEAADFYHIGMKKIRQLIDEYPDEEFYILNGNRILIKKKRFEEFLDQMTAV